MSPQELSRLATEQWGSGKLKDAEATCRRLVELSPGDPLPRNSLGLCLLAQGDASAAETVFREAIQIAPQVALLQHNLGLSLQTQNRIEEAVLAFRSAVQIDPNLFASITSLAHLLLIKGDWESVSLLKRAYELAPNSVSGKLELVRALLVSGNDLERAASLSEEAIAKDPANAPALVLLAMALQRLGRGVEALDPLRKAIQLDPAKPAPYWELFYGKKVTPDDYPLVEALARQSPQSEHEQRIAAYALGKAYNDLGRYGEAMAEYDGANRLSKHIEGKVFDKESYVKQVDATIAVFDRAQDQNRARLGNPGDRPIFIVGMFRSGTTLVEHILSSHPLVAAGGEIPFWPKNASRCVSSGLHYASEISRTYLKALDEIDARADRITDKHPENYWNVGLLHSLYPNARFVFCTRHPADNCLSLYFTYFMKSPPYACDQENIVLGYNQHLRLLEHWRQIVPPDRFIQIRYEELTAEPEPHIRRLIDFADLDWDPRCLHPELNAREVTTASRWQVRQPIYRSSVERWRRYEPFLGAFRQLLENS